MFEPGNALSCILGSALDGGRDVAVSNQGLEAKPHRLLHSNLLVLDVAVLAKVFVTLLLLLRRVVGLVGSMTALGVAVLAVDDVVVLSLLGHDDLVNTSVHDGEGMNCVHEFWWVEFELTFHQQQQWFQCPMAAHPIWPHLGEQNQLQHHC